MKTMERILRLMVERKASDVYFTANATAQMRISGQCVPINAQILPSEAPLNLLAEMVSDEQIDELTRTGELNTAIPLDGLGNFRISAMRQRGTYAVVVRHIPSRIPALSTLGLPDILRQLVMERRGLVLMVGATGAGKSTTLASMLDYRNENASGHILTVEEPVEFLYTNKKSMVNQRDVGSDTRTLQIALKNALRQAPDVIQIGEIRDRETMTAAISYAQSGHLVLATLHANNAFRAMNRVLSFYPVEVRPTLLSDLAASMRAVVAQRLLRTPSGSRLPAVEVMLNTVLVAELIEKGDFSAIKEAMTQSMAEGSQTFEEDIARMIIENRVDRAEGLAQADSPTNLLWRLQNYQAKAPATDDRNANDHDDEPEFADFQFDSKAA